MSSNDVTLDHRGLVYLIDRIRGVDVIETAVQLRLRPAVRFEESDARTDLAFAFIVVVARFVCNDGWGSESSNTDMQRGAYSD